MRAGLSRDWAVTVSFFANFIGAVPPTSESRQQVAADQAQTGLQS